MILFSSIFVNYHQFLFSSCNLKMKNCAFLLIEVKFSSLNYPGYSTFLSDSLAKRPWNRSAWCFCIPGVSLWEGAVMKILPIFPSSFFYRKEGEWSLKTKIVSFNVPMTKSERTIFFQIGHILGWNNYLGAMGINKDYSGDTRRWGHLIFDS